MPAAPSPPPLSRREFLRRSTFSSFSLVLTGGVTALGHGYRAERHDLEVKRQPLSLALGARGPKQVRIATISDLHFDPLYEESYVSTVVQQVNALQPDLVLLTGDYITRTNRRIADLAKLLGALTPNHGTYACLGNHDYNGSASHNAATLQKEGLHVLRNQHSRVTLGSQGEIILAGLDSVRNGKPNWTHAAKGLQAQDPVIMLMHEPDYARKLQHDPRIVLQCSGHTHGGQICMPGVGAVRLPLQGKLYASGLYTVGTMQLYVNRGIGTIGLHVRLLCKPEITCFEVVNSDAV